MVFRRTSFFSSLISDEIRQEGFLKIPLLHPLKDEAFSCFGFGEVADLDELKVGECRPSGLMTLSILQLNSP
jgi:hypothetical protein